MITDYRLGEIPSILCFDCNTSCCHYSCYSLLHFFPWYSGSQPGLLSDRYIQSTCATTGEGLYEGLDWLSSNIASKVQNYSFSVQLLYYSTLFWYCASAFSKFYVYSFFFQLRCSALVGLMLDTWTFKTWS